MFTQRKRSKKGEWKLNKTKQLSCNKCVITYQRKGMNEESIGKCIQMRSKDTNKV